MKTQKRKRKEAESSIVPSSVTKGVELEYPPAEHLLEKAAGEVDRKLLDEYLDTIRTLRDEKHFSFREIAVWLAANGVPADRNSVYRAYTKHMDAVELAETEEHQQEQDREEQERERR